MYLLTRFENECKKSYKNKIDWKVKLTYYCSESGALTFLRCIGIYPTWLTYFYRPIFRPVFFFDDRVCTYCISMNLDQSQIQTKNTLCWLVFLFWTQKPIGLNKTKFNCESVHTARSLFNWITWIANASRSRRLEKIPAKWSIASHEGSIAIRVTGFHPNGVRLLVPS